MYSTPTMTPTPPQPFVQAKPHKNAAAEESLLRTRPRIRLQRFGKHPQCRWSFEHVCVGAALWCTPYTLANARELPLKKERACARCCKTCVAPQRPMLSPQCGVPTRLAPKCDAQEQALVESRKYAPCPGSDTELRLPEVDVQNATTQS